jgi:hypothetical protein
MNPPSTHGGFGDSDPYKHFSSTVLLKRIIEEQPNPTVKMGPTPGTVEIDFGDLKLIAKIMDSKMSSSEDQ